jgi:hypothetical protein
MRACFELPGPGDAFSVRELLVAGCAGAGAGGGGGAGAGAEFPLAPPGPLLAIIS